MDVATMYGLMMQGNGAFSFSGGGDLADPTTWGPWVHEGHRLWASMSDEFWVYVYKVRRCPHPCSHDWTACPYAHKGERARRRDPRRFHYGAVSCPEYKAQAHAQIAAGGGPRTEGCRRGLKCRYAHGVFELWLHPNRFRTRMCEAGPRCPRPICFFAHFTAQLRGDDHIAASAAAVGSGDVPFSMYSLPRAPPRLVQHAPTPPPVSPPPAAVSRHLLFDDLAWQVTSNRLPLMMTAPAPLPLPPPAAVSRDLLPDDLAWQAMANRLPLMSTAPLPPLAAVSRGLLPDDLAWQVTSNRLPLMGTASPPPAAVSSDLLFDGLALQATSNRLPLMSTSSPPPAAVSRDLLFDDLALQATSSRLPLMSTASPPAEAASSDLLSDDQDWQAMAKRLRLLTMSMRSIFATDTSFSAAATPTAAVPAATGPTLMALPADGDDDVNGGRCAEEEEDSDYPHIGSIMVMDLVS